MTNFSNISPDAGIPPSSIEKKEAPKTKIPSDKKEVSSEEMMGTVQHPKSVVRAQKPPKSSTPLEPLQTQNLVQKVKKEKPKVSPARELAGQRVYHFKRDILPWIENMYKSGERANQYIFDKFKERVEARSDLSQDQRDVLLKIANQQLHKSLDRLNKEKVQTLEHPKLSENLDEILLPEKKEVLAYKTLSKSAEQSIHENIREYSKQLQQNCLKECKNLPPGVVQTINDFQEEMTKNARNIEGIKRFEIIHEGSFWNPEKVTKRPVALVSSETDEAFLATSIFQAAGPAYSSQAPRNRPPDEACPPNFFRSQLKMRKAGIEEDEPEELLLDVTRSATTVEFDQKDPEVRSLANQRNLEQVVDQQVTHWIQQLTEKNSPQLEAATDPEHPLIFKGQTVNLLTPDILRSLTREHDKLKKVAAKIHHDFTGAPADDERALALENMKAHQYLNNQLVPYTLKTATGEEKTIYVKYDLRYFNIPNNVLYSKLPQVLTDSKELRQSNNESWDKLEKDIGQQVTQFNSAITEASQKVKSVMERRILNDTYKEINNCLNLRKEIMLETIKKGHVNEKKFKEWQDRANALAARIRLQEKHPFSEEFKETLALMKKRDIFFDLYLDTRELFMSGLSKNLRNMDNNRSALATRIILLGAMVEGNQVHFGCRSGKDRTGLVDIELKLLASSGHLVGRIPSYHEQEQLTDTINHREQYTSHSGNVFDFVEANLGANVGMNTGGAASQPLELNETGEQYKEFTEGAQAAAKIASRPATNWIVPAGFQSYWKGRDRKTVSMPQLKQASS